MIAKTKLYGEMKVQAIALRKQGKTFSEICAVIGPVPKGTLSHWLKSIELTQEQQTRIKKSMSEKGLVGRHIGAQKNHQNRLRRLEEIRLVAQSEYEQCVLDSFFLAGLLLYLAEGTKKTEQFHFMNSDPKLVQYMVMWVTKFSNYNVRDLHFRLYIHELYAHEKCESFWIKELGVDQSQFLKTIYKPTGRVHKKNPTYKGCVRLEIPGSELYWKTMTWRDCFYATLR